MLETNNAFTKRILIALALGILLGLFLHIGRDQGDIVETYLVNGLLLILGKWLISLLMVLVVPLVFISLVKAMGSLIDTASLGKFSLWTVSLYLITTMLAISTGLMFAWAWSPGAGMELTASDVVSSTPPNLFQSFVELIPTNAFHALAQGNMLQVIVLALIVGIALSRLNRERPAAVLMQGLDELDRLMLKLVSLIMMFVPIGVFALMARSTATLGVELLLPLLGYVLVLISALLFHALVSYSLLIKQLTGLSMLTLMRELKPLWLFSFSTASSAASIPVTLATCDRLRISPQLSRFTIPLGATLNMDGTAIMQGVATVFIANAYGIALLPMDYLMIIVTATLASIGTAAVPGAGLVMLTLVLTQAGLPIEGIALILGVDRLLDMLRTSVNVTGDVVVSYIVAYKTDFLDSSRENAVENSRV